MKEGRGVGKKKERKEAKEGKEEGRQEVKEGKIININYVNINMINYSRNEMIARHQEDLKYDDK